NLLRAGTWALVCVLLLAPYSMAGLLAQTSPSKKLPAAPPDSLPAKLKPELVAQIGHSSSLNSAVFSPGGRYVLTAGGDPTARLWETATGNEIRQFKGHTNLVNSAVFSSDGRYVLTASFDGTARLWEMATGKEIRQFKGH